MHYIWHRTVGAHLRQIFAKLGITSRTQPFQPDRGPLPPGRQGSQVICR